MNRLRNIPQIWKGFPTPNVNEEWLTFADGTYSGLFETIKTPMRNAEGEIIGILGVMLYLVIMSGFP